MILGHHWLTAAEVNDNSILFTHYSNLNFREMRQPLSFEWEHSMNIIIENGIFQSGKAEKRKSAN